MSGHTVACVSPPGVWPAHKNSAASNVNLFIRFSIFSKIASAEPHVMVDAFCKNSPLLGDEVPRFPPCRDASPPLDNGRSNLPKAWHSSAC